MWAQGGARSATRSTGTWNRACVVGHSVKKNKGGCGSEPVRLGLGRELETRGTVRWHRHLDAGERGEAGKGSHCVRVGGCHIAAPGGHVRLAGVPGSRPRTAARAACGPRKRCTDRRACSAEIRPAKGAACVRVDRVARDAIVHADVEPVSLG